MTSEKTITADLFAGTRQTRVPLDDVEAFLLTFCESVEREDLAISFEVGCGKACIEVEPVSVTATDGHEISDIVHVRTLPDPSLDDLSDKQLTAFNVFAAMGALVRDRDTGRVTVEARYSMFAEDGPSWRLYTPMVAGAALAQGDGLIQGVRVATTGDAIERAPRESQLPSQWGEDEFLRAWEMMRRAGSYANAGATGLTAEVAMEPGGLSAMLGDVTALITLKSDMPHPGLGSGLFYKLELPTAYEEDELVALACELNRQEVIGVEAPPSFGAWCANANWVRLAYVGFIPNVLYVPGSAANVCSWLLPRALQARAFVENLRAREGAGDESGGAVSIGLLADQLEA